MTIPPATAPANTALAPDPGKRRSLTDLARMGDTALAASLRRVLPSGAAGRTTVSRFNSSL